VIDRDLLWKAWPDGYLAMRGVGTVGGYQFCADKYGTVRCLPRAEDKTLPNRWAADGSITYEAARKRGDLLPNVDPDDVATWGCLLHDLGVALYRGNGVDPDIAPGGLLWRPHRGDRWILEDIEGNIGHMNVGQETDDPGLALVLARIQLREWAAAPTYGPDE
jgi:hypothetical protein